jgi:hypothetical protein
MVASRRPGPIGLTGEAEDLDDGTSIRGLSPTPGPLGIGATSPDRVQNDSRYRDSVEWAFQRLRAAADSEALQRTAVGLLGPQCFSVGVIAGIGADILNSAVDLLKLVGKFVLADLHDIESGQIHWSRYFEPTIAPRLIIAKLANKFFGSELRRAAEERDALVKEMSAAFQDPKATFEGLKDNVIAGYQKDWQDYKAHMSAGTLEGRYRAGMIFGKLLMVILGVLTGVYGAAKLGAKAASQLPRLAEIAKKFKFKRSADSTGRASGEAMTPSQLREEVQQGTAANANPDAARAGTAPLTNPGYPAPGRLDNCANCAIATDATFGGRPASALPQLDPRGVPISDIPKALGVKGNFVRANSLDDVSSTFESFGAGSRGVVFADRGPGQVGHVFNVVVDQGGAAKFWDGQSMTRPVIEGQGYKSYWWLRSN